MTSLELKKYRCDMRNAFLTEMYEFSVNYDNLLYFLDIQDEERLVEIVKNKVFEFAEVFDIIDYNYFFQTEIGNAIISLFSDVLEQEGDKLYYIEAKVNSSYIINWLYFVKKRVMCSKWLLEYRKLCSYYSSITLDKIMDDIIDKFNKSINKEEGDIRTILISEFNNDIEFLVSNDKIDKKYSSSLIKILS